MTRFGFIGMGIMGSAMAANLVRAGFEVVVWNRSPQKCAPLQDLGARIARTPRALVAECPVTFAMLADPQAAADVCFGQEGVCDAMVQGKGYVDMSTIDAATSQRIAAAIREKGGRFLEAPVSGSKKPAEDGTLVILSGGDRTLYEEVEPAFAKMGKRSFYLGDVGQGARMKLVVNMIMGAMMAAFCEGLVLGERGDLDPETILEVLDAGALANPMFRLKGPRMLAEDFAVNFPLKHMQKDLRLALLHGDETAQPLHVSAAANEAFKQARAQGLGDEDFSALLAALRTNSG